MTEEQKAWFTYGHAVGCLESFKHFRETLDKLGIRHDGYSDEITCELVGKTESAKERAVAWNPESGRNCMNCACSQPGVWSLCAVSSDECTWSPIEKGEER